MWILVALVSAATLALVHLTDKRLLDHHLPNIDTLYAWVAIGLAVYIAGALAIFGIPGDTSFSFILVALASGLALGIGYALLFVALKVDEASRAVAISQIYPIFVALLAVPFLGEHLSPFQWASIILVVLGTMIISLPAIPRSRGALKPSRGVPAAVVSGLFLAVGFFTAKLALSESSLTTVFIYQQVGTLLAFLPFCRPSVCAQLFRAMKQPSTVGLLLVGEGMLPLVVVAGALLATSLGPVSLVTAFLATTPLFVFLLATLLSQARWHLMEEVLSPRALAMKFAAIAMIVAGVSSLGLF